MNVMFSFVLWSEYIYWKSSVHFVIFIFINCFNHISYTDTKHRFCCYCIINTNMDCINCMLSSKLIKISKRILRYHCFLRDRPFEISRQQTDMVVTSCWFRHFLVAFLKDPRTSLKLNSPAPIVPSGDVWCLNGY